MNYVESETKQPTPRLLAPDLARGMMLLFIAIANVSVYLWGQEGSGLSVHPAPDGPVDAALSAAVIVLIDGHVYPLFAFLFGYGISQFAYSRINVGERPRAVGRMLLRRHLWMLAFGAVHALLLFAGDILGAYALTGMALSALLLYGSDRLIKILLWVLGAISVLMMLGAVVVTAALSILLPVEQFQLDAGQNMELGDEMWTTASMMNGIENYWLAMLARFGIWVGTSFGAVFTLLVPFIVLLGGLAARYRWLEGAARRITLGRVAVIGIAVGVLGSVPSACAFLQLGPQDALWGASMTTLAQLSGVAGGLGYAALFGYIGLRVRLEGVSATVVHAIAAVGKRSLSFYLLQSVVFAPLLAAWGLGLGAQWSSTQAFTLALVVWLVSVGAAVWLEHTGRRGPAEVLLRRLTYGRAPSRSKVSAS